MPPFKLKKRKLKPVTTPLKMHGGKHYLTRWIVAKQPPRSSYITRVEHCLGGGSWMLQQDPADVAEVVNDVDGNLTSFWTALQSPDTFSALQNILEVTPFSQLEFEKAEDMLHSLATGTMVERAAAFFVRCRQSMAGRRKSFTPLTRSRLRGGMNAEVNAWLGAIDGLPAVHARIQRWLILNGPLTESIKRTDHKKTLHYLDPPYLDVTRTSPQVYDFEMTRDQHEEMLEAALNAKGFVMISGYQSKLYRRMLKGWTCHMRSIPNHSSSKKEKELKIECLWCNF